VLGPPAWLNPAGLERNDRAGLQLFKTCRQNAPPGIIPANGTTVQGVYCITAEGDFLSGYFAWAFRARAKGVIEQGWDRFEQLARQRNWEPQPVPKNRLDNTMGKPVAPGGMKLEVAVRDLPRDSAEHPGRDVFQRSAHNLNWVDFTAAQAAAFVTESEERQQVPLGAWQHLALHKLKDAVRGQCSDWKPPALRRSELFTQLAKQEGAELTLRITGDVSLRESGRSFTCQLHGLAVYDRSTRQFSQFNLVAAGQRSGRTQFNFRQDDGGPAPLGVAFSLHR
jgi:hypothetical protein